MGYVIRGERLSHETLDGEVVIVDQISGVYFSLTGAGAEVWGMLVEPRSLAALGDALSARYAAEGVHAAVEALVGELVAENLIVETPDEGVALGAIEVSAAPWVVPRLEKFTDLQTLVLLDPIHDVDEDAGWPHTAAKGPR